MQAAKATGGKYAAIAQDRWDTLVIGIEHSDARETNSDLMAEWMADTREILGRMVHGASGDEEYQLLCDAEERLLGALADEATRLVESVEARRAASTKGAAA
jgi:hypothetical protein